MLFSIFSNKNHKTTLSQSSLVSFYMFFLHILRTISIVIINMAVKIIDFNIL